MLCRSLGTNCFFAPPPISLPCEVKWGLSSWEAAVPDRGGGGGGLQYGRGSCELLSVSIPGMNTYKSSYWFSELSPSTSGRLDLDSAPGSCSSVSPALSGSSDVSVLRLCVLLSSWWNAGDCVAIYDEDWAVSLTHIGGILKICTEVVAQLSFCDLLCSEKLPTA